MTITFHDLFCGAGGSTLGAALAGATPLVAANHWPVACESYVANHPDTRVDCADVCTVDPRRYPPADLLLASPECTHHSYARGRAKDDPSLFDPQGDQGAERSRATMWDVVRFTEFHRYAAIVVENVEAASKWGQPKGVPLAHDAYGPLFAAWLQAMHGLGYRSRLVHLNSMTVGVPQSRDRLYVVFWRKGMPAPDLDLRPPCWCSACGKLVEGVQAMKRPGTVRAAYGTQYVYACPGCGERVAPVIRPAASAIDWTLPAPRIRDRARPLQPNTIARIRRGLDRLEHRGDVVTLDHLAATGAVVLSNMAHGVPKLADAEPADTVTTGNKLALVTANRRNAVAKDADRNPLHTLDTKGSGYLVMANRENAVPRPAAAEPLQTVVTQGGMYLVEPMQIDLRGENRPRPADGEPLSTIAARGQHHGIAYVVANYTPGWVRGTGDRELGTITATDHHSLLTYRGHEDARVVDEPASTLTTVTQHALVGHGPAPSAIAVEDCGFRMLEPHELQAAQGFPADYVLTGNKRDQVAQIGNAVSAPAEAQLVGRVLDAIGGRS